MSFLIKTDKAGTSITFYFKHLEIDKEELNRILEKTSNKLQKDLTNIVKNNPLDAVSVMQLVTAYNQTVFANNMLFLNNLFKKN